MKINNIVFSLLALAMLCSFKNCGEKEKFPEYVDMVFMIPVSISPVKENYFIGDTILIEINTPDSIREFYSSEYFKLKEFNFAIRLLTLELVSEKLYLSQQPGNASSFNVISEIGSFHISGSLGGYIATVYNDERYSLKIKLIPNRTSLNCLSFISGYAVAPTRIDDQIDLGVTPDGRQRIPVIRDVYFIVNEGNNNFEMLEENCLLALNNVPAPINLYGERYGTFTFRVVE